MRHVRAAGGDRDRVGVRALPASLVDRLRRRLLRSGVDGSCFAGWDHGLQAVLAVDDRQRRARLGRAVEGLAEQPRRACRSRRGRSTCSSGARRSAGCSSSPGTGGARTCPSPAVSRPDARYATPRSSMKRVGECVGREPDGSSLPRADSEPPITFTPGETSLSAS